MRPFTLALLLATAVEGLALLDLLTNGPPTGTWLLQFVLPLVSLVLLPMAWALFGALGLGARALSSAPQSPLRPGRRLLRWVLAALLAPAGALGALVGAARAFERAALPSPTLRAGLARLTFALGPMPMHGLTLMVLGFLWPFVLIDLLLPE